MDISVFGLGYVGCVSLGCLAKNDHKVIGVDINQNKVDLINSGKPTIIEKGIDEIIEEQVKKEKIFATSDPDHAVKESDVSFICVGTPSTENGHLNLDYVYKVANEIGKSLKNKSDFHTIVVRSTVLPGTNRKVGEIISEQSGKIRNKDFAVVSNPEFLREGNAVYDYYNPPVTVIGTDCNKAIKIMEIIYSEIDAPIKLVDIKVAEIIKYVNNSFHALKISFANEIGNICKALGIDSYKVMELFIMDKKLNLSSYYLKPGFAYGGSCLPKDLNGLQTISHDNYLNTPLIDSIEKSNQNQKKKAIKLIEKYNTKKIGIIGFSFKPGTDDLRQSPIVEVAEYFLGKGYAIRIFDENITVSKLTGTNKSYIDTHIPHFSELITDNLDNVIDQSELIIINHKINEIESIIDKNPNKQFIELTRINNEKLDNIEGICW